jgi:uncharacterized protein DUF6152
MKLMTRTLNSSGLSRGAPWPALLMMAEATTWALEATGPMGIFRNGVKKEDVQVGDKIKARCHLLRDGSPGCLLGFVTPMHGDQARGNGVEHQWD